MVAIPFHHIDHRPRHESRLDGWRWTLATLVLGACLCWVPGSGAQEAVEAGTDGSGTEGAPVTTPSVTPPSVTSPNASANGATAAESAESIASLSERVKSRWKALADNEPERAYEFELPSYRALYDLQDFASTVGLGPAAPRNPTIVRIDLDLPRAKVALEFEVAMRLPQGALASPMVVSHTERWLLRDGTWWHVAAFGNDRGDYSATE